MKLGELFSYGQISKAVLIAMLTLATSRSVAVAKSGSESSNYAVVDMQAVILNVAEGKKAREDLEKEIKAKESELMGKKQELDKLNQDWKENSALLSEEARQKKQQDFQQKFMELRNDEMAFQNEIKRKEQMATQKIAVSVSKFVNDLAKKRGYEMVFETNSAGLLYLKDPVDLTKEVIDSFGSKSSEKSAKK